MVVSDDASPCTFDPLLRQISLIPNVTYIAHKANRGIAQSLNAGLLFAQSKKATWLLTLDQDSSIAEDYIGVAQALAERARDAGLKVGALGAGDVRDASGSIRYPTFDVQGKDGVYLATHEVLQSGTIWDVAQLAMVGGFREGFNMDAIDAAACLALRSNGALVLVGEQLVLHHHLGDAQQYRVFGRSVIQTGHSAKRRRSIMRNRLQLFPQEFRQSPTHALRTVRRALVNEVMSLLPRK